MDQHLQKLLDRFLEINVSIMKNLDDIESKLNAVTNRNIDNATNAIQELEHVLALLSVIKI